MNLQAYMKLDASGFTSPLAGARNALGGFLGTLKSAIGPLAALAGIGSIGAGALKAIHEAADAESLQTAFATMLGSAKQAEETLASLRKLAAETPFEMPEVGAAARSLLSFGSSAGHLESELRSVGDVASGASTRQQSTRCAISAALARRVCRLQRWSVRPCPLPLPHAAGAPQRPRRHAWSPTHSARGFMEATKTFI